MGGIFAFASALPLLIVFFGTHERPEFSKLEQPGLSKSLKAAAKNRPFIFGMVIFLLTWVSIDILQTTLLYFLKYVVQREADSDLIMAVIFVTAMLVLPFWEWASRQLEQAQGLCRGDRLLGGRADRLDHLECQRRTACDLGLVRPGRESA